MGVMPDHLDTNYIHDDADKPLSPEEQGEKDAADFLALIVGGVALIAFLLGYIVGGAS